MKPFYHRWETHQKLLLTILFLFGIASIFSPIKYLFPSLKFLFFLIISYFIFDIYLAIQEDKTKASNSSEMVNQVTKSLTMRLVSNIIGICVFIYLLIKFWNRTG